MQRLATEPDLADWVDRTQLIAGTSTGGVIALCVAAGIPLDELRDLYTTRAGAVFEDSLLDDLRDVGKVFGADYDVENLEREAHRVLGDRTLAQLSKRVLVTTFDLDNEAATERRWKAKLFHNFPGPDCDADALAYRIAVATAAAPTYFASYDGYVDGGVFATNPSMCALAQTLDARVPASERAELGDVRMLSFGTGHTLRYIEGDRLDWGYWQWVRPLLDVMLDGVNGIVDFQCAQLLGARYHRLAPMFPPGTTIGMDAVDQIPYLIEFAQGLDLSATADWLRANW
jgi:predicted acylesterase/phospholipase RssA